MTFTKNRPSRGTGRKQAKKQERIDYFEGREPIFKVGQKVQHATEEIVSFSESKEFLWGDTIKPVVEKVSRTYTVIAATHTHVCLEGINDPIPAWEWNWEEGINYHWYSQQ